ncbi:LBP [Trichuris trichiura]|uniref:LBP n=1 Tax=Trichuris trichiura TaxID=36087 RepID=A0A077ZHA2_TRITR|nr:LBP [Trichuris trichiura]
MKYALHVWLCLAGLFGHVWLWRFSESKKSDNPGIAVRITNHGFLYLKDTIQEVLRKHLSNLHISEVHEGTFLRVRFALRNFRIVRLTEAEKVEVELRPQAAQQIRLSADRFDMDFEITIYTSMRHLERLVLLVSIEQASFSETIQLTVTENRQLKVTSHSCTFRVGPVSVSILEYDGRKGLAKIVRRIFARRLHQLMQDDFCKRLSNFTETSFAKIIAGIPIRQPLTGITASSRKAFVRNSKFGHPLKRSAYVGSQALDDPLRNFYVDMGLVNKPVVILSPPIKYLLLAIKGEISQENSAEAPFHPKRIANLPGKRGVMLYIVITDYPINSMLYHLYQDGLLNYNFSSKSNDEMGKFLRVNCDDLMCIGFGIPELELRYADYDIEATFALTEVPVAKFDADKATVTFEGKLEFFATKRNIRQKLFAYTVKAVIDPQIRLQNGRIRGKARFEKFTMNRMLPTTGQLRLEKIQSELLATILKSMIESKLNSILSKGMSLPETKVLKFVNPEMKLAKNAVWLMADIKLDVRALESLFASSGNMLGR